ncbi:hypothetical protein [Sideroxydans sp. CL21]|uniref:hypothetical protein n=1 Tax=Sideroxydans sp. CL21 TaxID=2600596 RepID=UPI0024BCC684|nr:hypothetical protein [Sideroxydans sp. CL21]
MTIKHVIFVSQQSACERAAWRNWSVISITDINFVDAPLQSGWQDVLRLKFDDISEINHDGYVRMGELQARAVIEFVQRMNEDKRCEGILVHCWAGVSRSAAVAKWISERYRLSFPKDYAYANQHVYMLLREESLLI